MLGILLLCPAKDGLIFIYWCDTTLNRISFLFQLTYSSHAPTIQLGKMLQYILHSYLVFVITEKYCNLISFALASTDHPRFNSSDFYLRFMLEHFQLILNTHKLLSAYAVPWYIPHNGYFYTERTSPSGGPATPFFSVMNSHLFHYISFIISLDT